MEAADRGGLRSCRHQHHRLERAARHGRHAAARTGAAVVHRGPGGHHLHHGVQGGKHDDPRTPSAQVSPGDAPQVLQRAEGAGPNGQGEEGRGRHQCRSLRFGLPLKSVPKRTAVRTGTHAGTLGVASVYWQSSEKAYQRTVPAGSAAAGRCA